MEPTELQHIESLVKQSTDWQVLAWELFEELNYTAADMMERLKRNDIYAEGAPSEAGGA